MTPSDLYKAKLHWTILEGFERINSVKQRNRGTEYKHTWLYACLYSVPLVSVVSLRLLR